LGADERITAVLPIKDYAADHFVFMATANGTVKKTPLEQFSRPRPSGLIAIDLEEGNTLVGAAITNGSSDIMLCSNAAKAARFKETDVRTMGRTAKGVRGIRLGAGQRVISLIIPNEDGYLLTASENGYGKRSLITDFPIRGRGAQGVIAMQTSDRNGQLVGAVQVFKGDELMLISNMGTLVRTGGDEVSIVGRNTQGVRLIKLKDGELLNSVGRIAEGSLVTDTEGSETESAAEGDVASTVADDVTDADTSQADGADTESE
jgi:DNA gyrase subunit A